MFIGVSASHLVFMDLIWCLCFSFGVYMTSCVSGVALFFHLLFSLISLLILLFNLVWSHQTTVLWWTEARISSQVCRDQKIRRETAAIHACAKVLVLMDVASRYRGVLALF